MYFSIKVADVITSPVGSPRNTGPFRHEPHWARTTGAPDGSRFEDTTQAGPSYPETAGTPRTSVKLSAQPELHGHLLLSEVVTTRDSGLRGVCSPRPRRPCRWSPQPRRWW